MEELQIRPYARLLTMLGDQLIKNESVALTELVKNAYDADACLCKINFVNFSNDERNQENSSIIVEDDGNGMSYNVITTHFLNPATPVKKIGKELRLSRKGRICQGEKGIGRFSMLKLGKMVTVFSKEEEKDVVHKITFDFRRYDEEFLTELKKNKEIFLDEVLIKYESLTINDLDKESLIAKRNHGTIISISSLKGEWDSDKIRLLEKDMIRFIPFEVDDENLVNNKDFDINIYLNKQIQDYKSESFNKIKDIVFHKALYKIKGKYDEKKETIEFSYQEGKKQDKNVVLYLGRSSNQTQQSLDFKGLTIYRNELIKYFSQSHKTECGNFSFQFYIFNFNANQHEAYGLSKDEKDIIRDHRVFLYRDDVRVQPYGAPDDDWLQIDRKRAADKAGNMFSNDQLFGQIKITKKENYNLKDKTSREGIIEDNNAFVQLITLVRAFLVYIRTKIYQNYIFNEQKIKNEKEQSKENVASKFSELSSELSDNPKALLLVNELESTFNKQENTYKTRLDTAERLAGVGLSVEVASHDIMLTIDRLKDNIHQTYIDTRTPMLVDYAAINKNAETAEGMIGLVYMKMKDLQQLFVSSKQRPKLTTVIDIIKKIQSIYSKQYADNNIKVEYEIIGSPVKATIIDAVLYQVFINLFDNALYWLQFIDGNRVVKIKLDGFNQTIIFSDNGIGISHEDAPFIFEAFYSGKGEEGRGLGLYIAKKLLNKSNYEIDLEENEYKKLQKGANFIISFITKE